MTESVQVLRDVFKGHPAYIVGLGPSLERLEARHFEIGPIIALNDSIIKIESLGLSNPIYSMQKDRGTVLPKQAPLIVHSREESNSAFPDYEPRYVFDNPEDFKLNWNTISQITAMELARFMGCNRIIFTCCDASDNGDNRTCIPVNNGGVKITNDLDHLSVVPGIKSYVEKCGLPTEWLTPGIATSIDKSELDKLSELKIMIATPFYDVKAFAPYISCLGDLRKMFDLLGIQHNYITPTGDPYVDRVKNSILSIFMQSEATDLLLIDSDLVWDFTDLDVLVNFLSSNHEIIAGIFPTKDDRNHFPVVLAKDKDENYITCPDTKMIQATRIPGGFVRFKRSAIQKMIDAYPNLHYMSDCTGVNRECYALFKTVISNHQFVGEDYHFCVLWEKIGGKIWVEPRIQFSHYGTFAWKGNLGDKLKSCHI